MAFNSLKSFDRLKSSGISEEQARTFTDLFEEVASRRVEHLATKEDLMLSAAKLENKINEVKNELKQDIAALGSKIDIAVTLLHHA